MKEKGYILSQAETQLGRMILKQTSVEEADIETIMMVKTIAQGIRLQFINAAKSIDPAKVQNLMPTAYYDPNADPYEEGTL